MVKKSLDSELAAHPVKLFFGLISSNPDLFLQVEQIASKRFGEIDVASPHIPFECTQYYEKELGSNLLRKFIAFEDLIVPGALSEVKVYTIELEEQFRQDGRRAINIDPGYLSAWQVVLASTKNFSHRIYLSHGVFAELTFFYQGKAFQPLPWAYPDFKSKEYLDFFNCARTTWLRQTQPKS
ncbi:DUF4416 family protein [Candidatus Omnitrophota bacterium]